MSRRLRFLPALAAVGLVLPVLGASDDPGKPTPSKLPKPLEIVVANLKPDLEKTGYFSITAAEYAKSEECRDDAFIWTVKVVKPITCRHAMMLLRYFRDVRFYDTDRVRRQELHCSQLYYSSRIESGAVDRRILDADEEFRLWLPLTPVRIQMLKSMGGDTVVFGERKE